MADSKESIVEVDNDQGEELAEARTTGDNRRRGRPLLQPPVAQRKARGEDEDEEDDEERDKSRSPPRLQDKRSEFASAASHFNMGSEEAAPGQFPAIGERDESALQVQQRIKMEDDEDSVLRKQQLIANIKQTVEKEFGAGKLGAELSKRCKVLALKLAEDMSALQKTVEKKQKQDEELKCLNEGRLAPGMRCYHPTFETKILDEVQYDGGSYSIVFPENCTLRQAKEIMHREYHKWHKTVDAAIVERHKTQLRSKTKLSNFVQSGMAAKKSILESSALLELDDSGEVKLLDGTVLQVQFPDALPNEKLVAKMCAIYRKVVDQQQEQLRVKQLMEDRTSKRRDKLVENIVKKKPIELLSGLRTGKKAADDPQTKFDMELLMMKMSGKDVNEEVVKELMSKNGLSPGVKADGKGNKSQSSGGIIGQPSEKGKGKGKGKSKSKDLPMPRPPSVHPGQRSPKGAKGGQKGEKSGKGAGKATGKSRKSKGKPTGW